MFDAIIAGDFWWSTVPGMSPWTLKSRIATDQTTFAEYFLPRAKIRPLTRSEELLAGPVLAKGTFVLEVWQESLNNAHAIPPAVLPCPLPKVADIVVDQNGVSWTIVSSPGTNLALFNQRLNMNVRQST